MKNDKIDFKKIKYIVLIILIIILLLVLSMILLSYYNNYSKSNILIVNNFNIKSSSDNNFSINEIFMRNDEVNTVSTVYSGLYKNDLNRRMYVFSTPVREQGNNQYSLFDDEIYTDDAGNYFTDNKNFNVYFNDSKADLQYLNKNFSIIFDDKLLYEKEKIYLDLYNQKRDGVTYKDIFRNIDLKCIPTLNGLMLNFNIQEINDPEQLKLKLDIGDFLYKNDKAGYIQILDDDDVKIGMIYQGICTDSLNNLSAYNKVKMQKINGDEYLVIDLKQLPDGMQYPITFSVNFDFYTEKMFFDTSVYEDTPNINCLLNNITTFDATNDGHAGYTYVKYNIKSITPKDSSLLDSITYNFYVMYLTDIVNLEIYKVDRNWCSWTLNWNNKISYKEKIGEISVTNTGWYELDITEYAKKLIDNNYDNLDDNSFVIRVKDDSRGYILISSADNTVSPPYFNIDYRIS